MQGLCVISAYDITTATSSKTSHTTLHYLMAITLPTHTYKSSHSSMHHFTQAYDQHDACILIFISSVHTSTGFFGFGYSRGFSWAEVFRLYVAVT